MCSSDYTVQTLELKLKVSEFGQKAQFLLTNAKTIFKIFTPLNTNKIFILKYTTSRIALFNFLNLRFNLRKIWGRDCDLT